MFKRTTWMALGMLGLGTVLGYVAAWGRLPALSGARADAGERSPEVRSTPIVASSKPILPGEVGPRGAVGEKGPVMKPGNPRGATTGPTDAPGYDHPNQYMFTKPTEIAKNMEPVIVHKSQVE